MKAGVGLVLWLLAMAAQAQTYRWVDQDGKVHFGDRPPVAQAAREVKSSAPVADKTLPYATRQAMANFPVTLHVSDDCGQGCKLGRDYLRKRGIEFTEKKVATQADLDSLTKLTGGEAAVPVLAVGNRVAKGWLLSDWQRLLDAAGYPREEGR